jgi:hypothetical protein
MKLQNRWLACALLALASGMSNAWADAADDGAAPEMAAGTPAAAPAPPAPLAWKSLPAEQQQLLQSHARDWDTLPAGRQRALAHGAQRWLQMDPAQREQARERFQTWRALPEERRELIRRRWERFQQLDPESQALVRENFRAYAQLPPWKRRMLRRRWLEATPAERAHMRERLAQRREHRRDPH